MMPRIRSFWHRSRGQRERAGSVSLGGIALLGFLVVVSALAVVYSKHQSRLLFIELQSLEKTRDAMNIEWERLQLEQSTWTTHGRIESLARTRLGMTLPAGPDMVIVRP